ncbi:hypothetical protein A8709_27245 [Paenibacillus pectinilyticus]|uniref:Uncharacterized protein n=1 Tax=Paenibacillus pectinilyticus TaxID=512399 RepID=A0A1C1A1U5_9BACL|nr:hypothetical protein [Paenibacillus pectinilyticus]OCT14499.1 hypothetical protein A8709_27245 [Paenibacillus pectinilyticus]
MKLYQSNLKFTVVVLCLNIINMMVQLLNFKFTRLQPGFGILFGTLITLSLLMSSFIVIDLSRKNYRVQVGKVVLIKNYRVHIQKSNGKMKKVDLKFGGIDQFSLGQPVELHYARLSRYLVAIHGVDEKMK